MGDPCSRAQFFHVALVVKNRSPRQEAEMLVRCLGWNGSPLWYSYLETPTDRGTWQVTGHRVTKNQTGMKRRSTHAWQPAVPVPQTRPWARRFLGVSSERSWQGACAAAASGGGPGAASPRAACRHLKLRACGVRFPQGRPVWSVELEASARGTLRTSEPSTKEVRLYFVTQILFLFPGNF